MAARRATQDKLFDDAQGRQRLLVLLSELSWQRGQVVLSSGKTSDFYIDCKQTALNAEGAWLIGNLVFARVQELRRQGTHVAGVGGLTLGADPIAAAAAAVSFHWDEPVHAFIIRKEPKSHGTRAWLEGGRNLEPGSPVLLVEDVVTTGASTLKALERARDAGLVPVAVVCLVDRQEGGRERIETEGGVALHSLLTRADFRP